jgi:hypothetical protein
MIGIKIARTRLLSLADSSEVMGEITVHTKSAKKVFFHVKFGTGCSGRVQIIYIGQIHNEHR